MKQKKIIYFLDGLNHGGVENVVLQLANSLYTDYEIHVIVLYEDQNEIASLFNSNIKIHYLPFNNSNKGIKKYIYYFNHLKNLIVKINPDIIHAHNSSVSYLYLAIAIYISKIKCKNIRTLHFAGFFLERKTIKDKVRFYLDKLGSRITRTVIIGVSPLVTQITQTLYKPNKSITICNGVDCKNKFNPNNNYFLPTIMNKEKHSDLNIIYVARLCEGKGHMTLLRAWTELIKRYNNIHLFIIGDGPLYNLISEYINDYNLKDNITLAGAVSNVDDYLAYSDLAVFPSQSEGFSLVLLEKMSMELPIIASSIPAFQFIIDDNITGLLFKTENYNDLSNKIEILINNQYLRKKIGKKAREIIVNNYSIEKMIEKYHNIYRNYTLCL